MIKQSSALAVIDGSRAFRSGSMVPSWDSATSSRPDAIILTLQHLGHIEPWLQIVSQWRTSMDHGRAHVPVLLHFIDSATQSVSTELMVKSLEAGIDDFIVAAPESPDVQARLIQARHFREMRQSLERRNEELVRLSLTDELTGLLNMRAFAPAFMKLSQPLQAKNNPVARAVVMMDLDRFKSINDTNDHLVGSEILRMVGRMIVDWLSDNFHSHPVGHAIGARYGGDEFILSFPAGDGRSALNLIEHLRKKIGARQFQVGAKNLRISASFGLAWWDCNSGVVPASAIELADAMLYRSKRLGRNRVSAAKCRACHNEGTTRFLLGSPEAGKVQSGNAIDFDHVRWANLVDRNSSRNDNSFARVDQSQVFKKVG